VRVCLALTLLAGCLDEGAVLTTRDGSMAMGRDFGTRDAAAPTIEGRRTLAAATEHTCAIGADGLYCWGSDAAGQLGNGSDGDSPVPVRVQSDAIFVSVVALGEHTCALENEGTLHCWGANDDGQLGLGDTMARDVPTPVPLPAAAVEVDAGQAHTCAILEGGELYCWGRNAEGQLGIEPTSTDETAEPTQVGTAIDWNHVSVHQGHSCGLRGTDLWCWGRNSTFQLGLGSGQPIQLRTPQPVGGGPWAEVAAGQNHGCALTPDGALQCWGDNTNAQLGTGDLAARTEPSLVDGGPWSFLDTDTFHGCTLSSGVIACWGRNAEGQLGTGDIRERSTPTVIAQPPSDTWTEVSTGRFHSCARDVLGDVYCTGANSNGQLGTGDGVRRREPTLVLRVTPE